jgi:hypothetical protein
MAETAPDAGEIPVSRTITAKDVKSARIKLILFGSLLMILWFLSRSFLSKSTRPGSSSFI